MKKKPTFVITPKVRLQTEKDRANFKEELAAKVAQYNLKNSESKND